MIIRKKIFFLIFLVSIFFSNLLNSKDPVVLELFTSQGCSSCPPAEKIFSSWGRQEFKEGTILPLAYHVDYWDYIGWKDPFASSDFTQLQRNYATIFHERSVYTPQLIIGGQLGIVGSNFSKIQKALPLARKKLIPIDWKLNTKLENGTLNVDVTTIITHPNLLKDKKVQIVAVLFENDLITRVTRGENRGKTLYSDFTVRYRTIVGTINFVNQFFSHSFKIPWSKTWTPKTSGLVLFLQDSNTLHIYSARHIYSFE